MVTWLSGMSSGAAQVFARSRTGSEVDRFGRGEFLEPRKPELAAETRALDAAEGHLRGDVERGVDPDDAAPQRPRDAHRLVEVLGPERVGEAVAGVVGDGDGFVGRAEARDGQDRPEDFLAEGRAAPLDPVEHGGTDIPATRIVPAPEPLAPRD